MIGATKEVCDEYRRAIELEGDSTAELKFGGRRGERPHESAPPPDHRSEMLCLSSLAKEIQVFDFDDDATWIGARSGSIVSAGLKNATGSPVGSQAEHTKQHRAEDAIFFHVVSSRMAKGLVGIPVQSITMEALNEGGQEFSA